jgi:prephenate dehydrogenase
MSENLVFKRAAILGVGLIGGSIARVLKKHGLAAQVVGSGRSRENLDAALKLGVIDDALSAEEAVRGADLVILCMPVLSIIPTLQKIASGIEDGALVTDVGSTKGEIVRQAEKIAEGRFTFIGSHPIAGSEKTGAVASSDSLFEGRNCIVTPAETAPKDALVKLKKLWQAAGMDVVEMDTANHDRVMAAVSHLPHMAAYGLVNTVRNEKGSSELLKFAAGGFKDFTRIAASSPEMWADITIENGQAVTELIRKMKQQLSLIESAIENSDREKLLELFRESQRFRQQIE